MLVRGPIRVCHIENEFVVLSVSQQIFVENLLLIKIINNMS